MPKVPDTPYDGWKNRPTGRYSDILHARIVFVIGPRWLSMEDV